MRRVAEDGDAETRFRTVFAHLGAVSAYARRRGSPDPDSIAAEVMTIAWRKLSDVPRDDPRPWLFATARNLLLVEWRQGLPSNESHPSRRRPGPDAFMPPPDVRALDPQLAAALRSLTHEDREALFLIAWEDLSPALAARGLGMSQAAFRVRLHRARRRLQGALAVKSTNPSIQCLGTEER
jgi:RNA polymerase sigma-70 factor (ECF subfamily)